MKELKSASKNELSHIKGVCFDIDDTFSSEGKILDTAFTALWDLKRAGFKLIPVTGRPAGWCDHIARFWPVDAVVGENGAFVFFMENGRRERFDLSFEKDSLLNKLKTLEIAIKKEFPSASFASDQAYREYDLAIDFCEDVAPWPLSEVDRLVKFCESHGARAKISSIHVNTWYGDFDKQRAIKEWFHKKNYKISEWVYVGDSPNDAPAFELFSNSIGVANINNLIDRVLTKPKFVTEKNSGEGFAELARHLIAKK